MTLCLALLLAGAARAEAARDAMLEQVGFGALESLSDEAGLDARALVLRLFAGESLLDGAAWREWLRAQWDALLEDLIAQAASLALPAALCGLVGTLTGKQGRAAVALRLLSCAACAGLMVERFARASGEAAGLLSFTARAANVLAPVLISAAALTGAAGGAGFTPAAALCAGMIENALADTGLKLCAAVAVLAALGGFSEALRLDRLFRLGKGAALWLSGGVTAAFMGLMSMEGLLASGRGGAAARTAHFALESLVPLIGGEVSEAMDALLGSARTLKGAVGVTGMALLAAGCIKPMLGIAASSLAAKLAGAAAGVAGEDRAARLMERFGEAMDMLAALCLAGVLMALMLAGGILSLGGV